MYKSMFLALMSADLDERIADIKQLGRHRTHDYVD